MSRPGVHRGESGRVKVGTESRDKFSELHGKKAEFTPVKKNQKL
jgi:hypothetical protein